MDKKTRDVSEKEGYNGVLMITMGDVEDLHTISASRQKEQKTIIQKRKEVLDNQNPSSSPLACRTFLHDPVKGQMDEDRTMVEVPDNIGVNPMEEARASPLSLVILADTKISNDNRLRHLLRLGYNGFAMVLRVGRSGGLVAIWKSNTISISILEDRQFLHFWCLVQGIPDFLFTSVYVLLHLDLRSVLWDKLLVLFPGISIPWVVWGDFN
ncbi:hypothetical protein K1719_014529 [Acacia pycnantha]|nr:hypothetical protein K1719_014529 [Acacia pycnantha]